MKIVVIWSRFGAYHLARLYGASEVAAEKGGKIVAIEIAQKDHYEWEVQSGSEGFERITIFPNNSYEALTSNMIRKNVTKILNDLHPDVVAINGWSVPEARAAISWCRKRHETISIIMSETKMDEGESRVWWKEFYKGWLVRQCDAALVGGRPQAEYIEQLGMPSEKIFLGYDVVDNEYFAREVEFARKEKEQFRVQKELPSRYFFVCTRFLPRKNIAGLLHAYTNYRMECPEPWDLVIAGGGKEVDALHQLQLELQLNAVHWPGFVQYKELPIYYGLASAFIHPALTEPWGLVVNEAATCGLPLLVSQTVGSRYELVEDGVNGILFDPQSPEEITTAMLTMSRYTDAQRVAMGQHSVEIVSKWSPRRFGEGLFSAIEAARIN